MNLNQSLGTIVSTLLACKWIHWESHWKSKGESYYGDHLLFQRIYEPIDDQIDGIVEKWMVQGDVPEIEELVHRSHKIVSIAKSKPGLPSLSVERALLKVISKAFDDLEGSGSLSLGLNDFLASLHSLHETSVYLLTQRSKFASIQHSVRVKGLKNPFGDPKFYELSGMLGHNDGNINDPEAPPTPEEIIEEEPDSDELSTLSRLEI